MDSTTDISPLGKSVTTDNGLLMQAEAIARYYVENACFPSVAILDDLLVHGRSLNQFLITFQSLLFGCVHKLDETIDLQQYEDDFYKSLTIWIFAINDAPFCLKQEYQWRLRYQNIWPESKWRELSNTTATYIWRENIANTSYILSAKVDENKIDRRITQLQESWVLDETAQYRQEGQLLFLLSDAYPYGVYPTVRSYLRKGYRYYTPYFFVRELEPNQVTLVLRKVFSFVDDMDAGEKISRRFITLFNRIIKHSGRLNVYCQLFYLILSQITLRVFISENLTAEENNCLTCDSSKIGKNFGSSEAIGDLLECFYRLPWRKEQLMELIRLLSEAKDEESFFEQSKNAWMNEEILNAIEMKLYVQALEHEEHARDLDEAYATEEDSLNEELELRTGEKEIFEILTEVREELNILPADIRATAVMLSYITQMMDCGDISLKARTEKDREGRLLFYSVLRNTEMSLSILPRRISDIFMDFFRVAQFYWRDDDFPQRVRCYFEENMTQEKSAREVKTDIDNTVKFAELIRDHKKIADSMLNWKSVFG